jgi:small subunit ribosomal protein S2
MIDLRLLIKNGVQFGHQTSRWCPKMAPYIWGYKNGIHLIDVSKTAQHLEKAAQFLEGIASQGRTILFVGTKKAAQGGVKKVAQELQLPYVVHRWVGGTFTNYRQVRKAIANMMESEEVLKKSGSLSYTKKELNLLKKRTGRLENIVGGIRQLSWPVGAVVVVDVKKEYVAVKEARASGIPVVALVDTNCDPSYIDYVIPGNDDAPRSIEVVLNHLGEAIARGQKVSAERPKSEIAFEETVLETLYVDEEDEALQPKKTLKAKPKKAEVAVEIDREEKKVPSVKAEAPRSIQRPEEAAVKMVKKEEVEKTAEKPLLKAPKVTKPVVVAQENEADKPKPKKAPATRVAAKSKAKPAKTSAKKEKVTE